MKLGRNSVVGTLTGLSRVEDLEGLNRTTLLSLYREDNAIISGFRTYNISKCVCPSCELFLSNTYLSTVTSPDTKVIFDVEKDSSFRVDCAHGTKLPIADFYGTPAYGSWCLDLSEVSDCKDAKVIDIRDLTLNVLLLLSIEYGYIGDNGGVALPVKLENDFKEFFENTNLEIVDYFQGPAEKYFITNRTAITDLISVIIESNRELLDEIVFSASSMKYFPALAEARLVIENQFNTVGLMERQLDGYYKSLNYILLHEKKVGTRIKGNPFKIETTVNRDAKAYIKEREEITLMYELIPDIQGTYLISDGIIFG